MLLQPDGNIRLWFPGIPGESFKVAAPADKWSLVVTGNRSAAWRRCMTR